MPHSGLLALLLNALCVSMRDQYCLQTDTISKAGIVGTSWRHQWLLVVSISGVVLLNYWLPHYHHWKSETRSAVKVPQLLPCQRHGSKSADAPKLPFQIITLRRWLSCLTNKINNLKTGVKGEAASWQLLMRENYRNVQNDSEDL